jgi:putative hydrolase of the HAD superfamily
MTIEQMRDNGSRDGLLSQNIRVISFDVGFTLLEPAPSFGGILSKLAACRGYDCDPDMLTLRFFDAHHKYAKLSRIEGKGMYACEERSKHWWDKITIKAYGRLINSDDAQPLADQCYNELSKGTSWKLYPDVLPALRELSAGGYRLIVLSNWDSRLPGILEELGIAGFFQSVYYSTSVEFEKPDEPFFRYMLEDLQIPANSVLHIGDNLIDDLDGASRMGMHGMVVKRKVTIGPTGPCPAGLEIDTLADLKKSDSMG